MTNSKVQSLSSLAWSIAEILRGDFKQSEYGKVVLPFVVLRRLDCILESSKDAVLRANENLPENVDDHTKDMMLFSAVGNGLKLYNVSKLTFQKIHNQDAADVHKNLLDYITNFNTSIRDIFLDKFLFTDQLKRLKDSGILWQVFEKFSQIDLHPDNVWMLTNRKEEKRRNKVQLIDASGERFWKSMRKSLGSKRREISEDACKEIVRLYSEMLNGDSDWGDYSKIFNTTDFGYREVRIERPKKLNFQVSEEWIELLKQEKTFIKLAEEEQEELLKALVTLPAELFKNRDKFEKKLKKALGDVSFKIPAQLKKAILSALSEKDETADICTNAKGEPEADSDLRDHELVPLNEDWKDYVEREVKPFVPDAWVDKSHTDPTDGEVGRVGYEINFNRYFYKYVPPRPVAEIDAELKQLEVEIAGLLREVAA